VEDHLHILTDIHSSVALSSWIKDINDKNRLIGYIKSQEAHHRHMSWPEELQALLEEHGVPYDEKYLL
jgi:hypothetical protein